MKKAFLLPFLACVALSARAYEHPMAAAIRESLDQYPIEPRIPELMVRISLKSSDLNEKGYQAYSKKRYEEAARLFEEAVETDPDNSFAWYNLACTYSLMGGSQYGAMLEPLFEAVRKEWFWGIQLMVDPDIDAWRYANVNVIVYTENPMNPDCPNFIHELHTDGTVTLMTRPDCGSPASRIGSGYYCIVCWKLFEFFPEVDEYAVDGPNGPIHIPA